MACVDSTDRISALLVRALAANLCTAIPAGANVYMLKHVLHGYEDEAAIGILRNCRAVLPPEGRLLAIEFVLPDIVDHADLELECRLMSDLNMLAVTGGKERSAVEWKALLSSAEFECRSLIPIRESWFRLSRPRRNADLWQTTSLSICL